MYRNGEISMKRHNGRIIAVLTLYNMDLNKLTDIETLNALNDLIIMESEEEFPVEIDTLYAHKIVDGVVNNLVFFIHEFALNRCKINKNN